LRKEVRINQILFYILLACYTGVMLYLFVMQCYEVPVFRSDMPDYVNTVRGIKGDYEFPYPLFFTLAKGIALFVGAPAGVAVATAFLNALGLCVTRHYMRRLVWVQVGGAPAAAVPSAEQKAESIVQAESAGTAKPDAQGMESSGLSAVKVFALELSATLLSFVLFLIGNLYSPKNTAFFGFDYAYRCMGIYTPNPFWNATYLATRPFTIICFFEGAKLLQEYKENFSWKGCVPFSVSLFLMTITKPSYTLVLVPLMGVIFLTDLIRTKGKSFKNAFFVCVTMLPTGIDLLYQFFGVFSGTNVKGEETGIAFGFAKVWSNFSKNIPLSIVMGMALAIGMAVLNHKELRKNFVYRFAWYNYLMATGMFLCFYEKGFRMMHANFSWGYMHGMFFVFFISLVLVLKNTVEWRKSLKAVFLPAEWAVLMYHLVCGINFLVYALQGNDLAGF